MSDQQRYRFRASIWAIIEMAGAIFVGLSGGLAIGILFTYAIEAAMWLSIPSTRQGWLIVCVGAFMAAGLCGSYAGLRRRANRELADKER